jgi:hypothetical protein
MSLVTLWTVESALSVPEITRNSVIRPAKGSATVFQMNAPTGPESLDSARASLPLFASVTATPRSAGEGTNDTIASISACSPMLAVADAQTTGKIRPAPMPRFSPESSSSCVSVPASKNFSMSASSASATISMSASRAVAAARSRLAGTGASFTLPLPSVVEAFIETRSTTPVKLFSSPIGS